MGLLNKNNIKNLESGIILYPQLKDLATGDLAVCDNLYIQNNDDNFIGVVILKKDIEYKKLIKILGSTVFYSSNIKDETVGIILFIGKDYNGFFQLSKYYPDLTMKHDNLCNITRAVKCAINPSDVYNETKCSNIISSYIEELKLYGTA